jgi:hypothetical protein
MLPLWITTLVVIRLPNGHSSPIVDIVVCLLEVYLYQFVRISIRGSPRLATKQTNRIKPLVTASKRGPTFLSLLVRRRQRSCLIVIVSY